jgi:hypothetical protein
MEKASEPGLLTTLSYTEIRMVHFRENLERYVTNVRRYKSRILRHSCMREYENDQQ